MTIKELLNQGTIMLKNEDIDGPKNKARAILQYTLKKSREYLIIYDNKEISQLKRDEYIKNIKRLIGGEPLQYITGVQEFMKMKFVVTKDVLIPQPDTEILVEEVIKIGNRLQNPMILDLCTGSGAIAVSLAKNLPNVKIIATDISKKAIEIAKYNAKLNGAINNIDFVESNLFDKLKNLKFDIIVSNPPYVPTGEIKKLPKDVRQEPILALDGGKDGLDFYRKIFERSHEFLSIQGYMCVEIGYNQKEAVKKIIDEQKRYINVYCKKDLCENDRVIVAERA